MLLTIAKKSLKDRRGFTLAEVLIASMIGTMVIASAWSVYGMVWQWWAEMSPRLDVERSARLTLLSVIEGAPAVKNLTGDVAGNYAVNSITYRRRNGIAWATAYPTISSDKKTITYKLVPDSSNSRQFYYGTYNGKGVVYYKHTTGTSYPLVSTLGITDLKFENFGGANNIIKVTVTAEKQIYGTRAQQPYTITVVYTDTVYLRTAL